MFTNKEIEQFYVDVEMLELKFPVAAIAEATGEAKGNVSKYLNRKKEPSQSFLQRFYQKFPKSSNNVSRETERHRNTQDDTNKDLSASYMALMEERIKELKEDKEWLKSQIESNLTGLWFAAKSIQAHQVAILHYETLRDTKGDEGKAQKAMDSVGIRAAEILNGRRDTVLKPNS